MNAKFNYWRETVEAAAIECGAPLTSEQLDYIAESVEVSHENFGMAFGAPIGGDLAADVEAKWKRLLREQEASAEKSRRNAEDAVRNVLKLSPRTPIEIGEHGSVRIIR